MKVKYSLLHGDSKLCPYEATRLFSDSEVILELI